MTTTQLGITELTQGQSQKEVTINTGFQKIDSAVAGYLVKSVAGSADVTLTATEWLNTFFEFTGALTDDVDVIVPITTRLFGVYNNTTGANILSIRTSAGTGVIVEAGTRSLLVQDGTDVRLISSGSGGGWNHTDAVNTLPIGAVAFWKFSNLNDSIGLNNFTNNNGVTFVAGKVGNAADFDGTNQSLTIADNTDLSMGDIDFTFAGWVQFDALPGQQILFTKGFTGAGTTFEYTLQTIGTDMYFGVSNGTVGQNAIVGSLATGTWYFFVAWHDSVANTINLQLNLGTISSTALTTGSYNSTNGFTVGSLDGGGSYLNGRLDAFGVYKNHVLTSGERSALYNSTNGFEPSGTSGNTTTTETTDNVGVGVTIFGADASRNFGALEGVDPTTYPVNTAVMWAKDRATGKVGWAIGTEDGTLHIITDRLGFFTLAPSTDIGIGGQVARTLAMERHLTADTAGNNFTDQSGGATVGATNKSGGARILKTGLGTGNALPGLIRFQGDAASATSGTTDHTQVDRFIPNGFKVLTDNTPINILSITIASNSAVGGVIHYAIEVTDGTDFQSETGSVYYSAVNKAGTVTVTINEVNSQQTVSAGTLTTVWAMSTANPALISVNADSSLTPSTGYPRMTFSVQNFGQQAIALA
jgi:hypothetical protein